MMWFWPDLRNPSRCFFIRDSFVASLQKNWGYKNSQKWDMNFKHWPLQLKDWKDKQQHVSVNEKGKLMRIGYYWVEGRHISGNSIETQRIQKWHVCTAAAEMLKPESLCGGCGLPPLGSSSSRWRAVKEQGCGLSFEQSVGRVTARNIGQKSKSSVYNSDSGHCFGKLSGLLKHTMKVHQKLTRYIKQMF